MSSWRAASLHVSQQRLELLPSGDCWLLRKRSFDLAASQLSYTLLCPLLVGPLFERRAVILHLQAVSSDPRIHVFRQLGIAQTEPQDKPKP
jgi:hypothetical protein